VRVAGPDAETYLQGQCSQDVATLGVGGSAWTFLLQPSGKVDVLARVTRLADGFVLEHRRRLRRGVGRRLRRFLLRTKATVEPLAWRCIAVRNPGPRLVTMGAALIARADWHDQPAFDILGETVEPPLGATRIEVPRYERLRVEAGWPPWAPS
jgi:folate-binding Fe-S cluster repair protein YgfZ